MLQVASSEISTSHLNIDPYLQQRGDREASLKRSRFPKPCGHYLCGLRSVCAVLIERAMSHLWSDLGLAQLSQLTCYAFDGRGFRPEILSDAVWLTQRPD